MINNALTAAFLLVVGFGLLFLIAETIENFSRYCATNGGC